MIVFRNLTPHAIHVYDEQQRVQLILDPSGTVARVTETREARARLEGVTDSAGRLLDEASDTVDFDVPVTRVHYDPSSVTGLPAPKADTYYVVSAMVMNAVRRDDVLCPGPAVRDAEGRVVGCIGFSRV